VNVSDLARNTSTAGYAAVAAFLGLCSFAVRIFSSLVPYSLPMVAAALEWLAMGLFVIVYLASWALLLIGAVRPIDRFSLRGNSSRRILNVGLAATLLVVIHVAIALGLAAARS